MPRDVRRYYMTLFLWIISFRIVLLFPIQNLPTTEFFVTKRVFEIINPKKAATSGFARSWQLRKGNDLLKEITYSKATEPYPKTETCKADTWVIANDADFTKDVVGKLKTCILLLNQTKKLNVQNDKLIEFSWDKIKSLPYQIVKIPQIQDYIYSRRSVAYLYAFANDAKYIVDMDQIDKDFEIKFLEHNNFKDKTLFSIETQQKVINPCNVFKSSKANTWPKGFPLEYLKSNMPIILSDNGKYKGASYLPSNVGIVHYFTQPDYISQVSQQTKIEQSPRCFTVPQGRISPFISKNTVYDLSTVSGLLFPVGLYEENAEIVRSYIIQRMFAKSNSSRLLYCFDPFFPPNSNTVLPDFTFYSGLENIVKTLNTIEVTENAVDSLLELYRTFYNYHLLQLEDIALVKAWATDISAINLRK